MYNTTPSLPFSCPYTFSLEKIHEKVCSYPLFTVNIRATDFLLVGGRSKKSQPRNSPQMDGESGMVVEPRLLTEEHYWLVYHPRVTCNR